MRSQVRGASWPLWGAAARRCRCPEGLGDDSAARSGRAGRRPACGPLAGAGAAQTRQIAQPDARDRGIDRLMVVVRLPSLLADQADGQGRFELEAATVGDALRALPVADLLLDERGELRRLVNVYVDGQDARRAEGLETPLDGVQEVRVIAAVAGGRG